MIKQRLAELVAEASDNAVTAQEALDSAVPLSALGLTSIGQMRLVDAIEAEFGVEVELTDDGLAMLDDLDRLAAFVAVP
ncbi:acyl carrier protein [Nonomuraea soli]|uniref:Acyl carrier protein n=1 Tax=Nonomuraea soli TaxID=1032476 RepID=A0A7W0CD45_9ACTN|nr:acyl carrier protein [Nonomuraea soli]MBA2888958.1 acyl carrier protein [Nonomuraea soli]